MKKSQSSSTQDVLITSGDDWCYNSCLNYAWDSMHLYASGYKTGAQRLFEHASAIRADQDTLLYPIIFLWRHYVELALKGLIKTARQIGDQPAGFPETHNILQLWQELRPRLQSIDPNPPKIDLTRATNIIQQLAELDPDSVAFRYPMNRGGAPTLPEDLKHVNLRNLNDVMRKLASFLDACDAMVDVILDCKQETEAALVMLGYQDEDPV